MLEQKGTKLQHYKGGRYTVLGLATHSEDGEKCLYIKTMQMKKCGSDQSICFMKKSSTKVRLYRGLK